jgi:uncharacterized protein (DUF58 family)
VAALTSKKGIRASGGSIPKELLSALKRIEIHTSRLANEQLVGTYHSSFKGQGLAFQEVRPYQAGDDIRSIDWNVSARMGDAFVKVFAEEREMTVMLLVDLSPSMLFGTKRAPRAHVASEIAALLSFSAIKNGDRVGLILGTDKVERFVAPQKGNKHVLRVVREVLGFESQWAQGEGQGRATRGTDLAAMLERLVRMTKRKSIAFVISDFLARDFERTLAIAAHKHDVIPVVLGDDRERTLPDVGLAWLSDLESGEPFLVDTSDPKVRDHFAREASRMETERKRLFAKLGLDVVRVAGGGSYVEPMRELFMRRARRARTR